MVERRLAYVDTSLLVKRYLSESDSAQAIALLDSLDIVTSSLTLLELTSALHAARRAAQLSQDDLDNHLAGIDKDRKSWNLLAITPSVLRSARNVIAKHAVRSLDAIHCASATLFRDERTKLVQFATLDARQQAAAEALGFTCVKMQSAIAMEEAHLEK